MALLSDKKYKNLDDIIIEGLIKEAEQDNADFAAAMRRMSDEEFDSIVGQPAFADSDTGDEEVKACSYCNVLCGADAGDMADYSEWDGDGLPFGDSEPTSSEEIPANDDKPAKSRFKLFRPWITAAVSAAAVILIVLIPSFNSMNAKLCDSDLYMSQTYNTAPRGGFDVYSASIEEIREELPKLKEQFESTYTCKYNEYIIGYNDEFQDAGWTLAVAYLKLHKKNDAVKVLKKLESQLGRSPFGHHCTELLKQLD